MLDQPNKEVTRRDIAALDAIERELRIKRAEIEQEIAAVEHKKKRLRKLIPGEGQVITSEGKLIVELAQKYVVNKFATDIGARIKGSNTHHLFRDHGWNGILVEKDQAFAEEIKEEVWASRVESFWEAATPENINRFVPEHCGVLCIDVDGNDYHLWNAVKAKPPIVVIEVGAKNVPVDVRYVAPYIEGDPKRHNGSNSLAMIELGKKKGYRLHRQIGVNLIFVR